MRAVSGITGRKHGVCASGVPCPDEPDDPVLLTTKQAEDALRAIAAPGAPTAAVLPRLRPPRDVYRPCTLASALLRLVHSFMLRLRTCLLLILLVGCTTEPMAPINDQDVGELLPSDLTLSVLLQGQPGDVHGDGSGIASIRATGTNVSSFRFRFENGGAFFSNSGELTYTFTKEGTNSHRITAFFFSETQNTDSISQDVTVYVDPRPSGQGVLVWSDEFDYEGPVDPSKWHHQVIPIQGDSWANNELQHYTDRVENSYVRDGTLRIVAKRESYTYAGIEKSYTSARLNSKFVFRYGRVDIRARLPGEQGTWPAFWTLGANIDEVGNFHGNAYGSVGWPACGEIDIMEQNGWNKNNLIGHLHWGDTQTGAYHISGGTRSVSGVSSTFNLYSLIWTEDSIQILLNDELFYEAPNTVGMPFDNPHYLLLNIAMGGTLGGAIPAGFSQAVMEVDYIRIYQ